MRKLCETFSKNKPKTNSLNTVDFTFVKFGERNTVCKIVMDKNVMRAFLLYLAAILGFSVLYKCLGLTINSLDKSVSEVASIFDCLYFSVVTITTLGYGDITPSTTGLKVVVIIQIMLGILIFGYLLLQLSEATSLLRVQAEKRRHWVIASTNLLKLLDKLNNFVNNYYKGGPFPLKTKPSPPRERPRYSFQGIGSFPGYNYPIDNIILDPHAEVVEKMLEEIISADETYIAPSGASISCIIYSQGSHTFIGHMNCLITDSSAISVLNSIVDTLKSLRTDIIENTDAIFSVTLEPEVKPITQQALDIIESCISKLDEKSKHIKSKSTMFEECFSIWNGRWIDNQELDAVIFCVSNLRQFYLNNFFCKKEVLDLLGVYKK